MDSSESRSAIVLELAEEFLDRYRLGQRPSLKEYIDRHPELADEIRNVFPAMAMMEKIALADESLEGDATGGVPQPMPPVLERLGDFRILREVGHGGMGIVYEAEQVSLGRLVALKVLPRSMVRDAKQVVRFEREAKAAAKLHHTNIVPVFGVGEQDGTPYYVMQFIAGLGLDDVIDELRRLRQKDGETPAGRSRTPGRDATALAVAHSLLTGRFESGVADDAIAGGGESATLAATDTALATTDLATVTRPALAPGSAGLTGAESSGSASSSSVILLGGSSDGLAKRSRPATYWQSVARVGIQVAEALDYAHKQGVVHRDVKPSNLLLDARGTVWVTDFGLAKAGDQDNITHTGDILGTLRYMPPEAFEGRSSALGDIYSLGLTLYELLAFRPAYEERDRNMLIKRVTSEEPPRLTALNREIPRDLETIVHKAIDRDPDHRYATAGLLAADLQRYLDDEPIRARPTTPMERSARWCRRNPLVASLAASLALLLIAATVGSLIGWTRMSRLAKSQGLAAERELAARLVATQEKEAAEEARRHESAQRVLAEQARHQTEIALQDAKDQRARALANFAKARAAVDNYLTKVSESQLLQVPGLQPLRRDLLRSALSFYQDFLKERGDDLSLRAELAATQVRIGRIYTDLGLAADARTILETAIATYEASRAKSPRDLAIRAALADTWQALGDVAYEHGKQERGQDMLAAYQKMIEEREALVHERPENLDYQKNLALAWNRLGIAQLTLKRYAAALDAYRHSTDIRHVLFRKLPDDPTLHYALGESFLNLGSLLANQGRHAEALAMYARSQEFYRFAYGKLPNMIEYGCDLGFTYLKAGQSYRSLGREEEATSELQKGVEHFRRMIRDHPAVPNVQRWLIRGLTSLADSHEAMRQPVAAARARREAGQWLDRESKDGPDAIFQNACFHAKQSIAVAQGNEPPTSQEQIDARREAERAIEQLNRAIEEGFSKLDAIRTSEDLAPLRGRDDFKQLVAKLADHLEKRPRASTGVATHAGPRAPLPKTDAERARRAKLDRATSLHAVGLAQLNLNQLDEARASLAEARALREQLANEDPANIQSRIELAATVIAQAELEWRSGRVAEAARSWDECIEHIESAAGKNSLSPADEGWLASKEHEIGLNYARLGLWHEAAAYFARMFRLREPHSFGQAWYEHALTLLLAHDMPSYRRLTERMLERPDTKSNLIEFVRIQTLAPGSAADPSELARLVAVAPQVPYYDARWGHAVVAFARYRSGQPDPGLLAGSETEVDYMPQLLPFQAMLAFRMGRVALARDWLRKADLWFLSHVWRALASPYDHRVPVRWWQHFAHFQIWRSEAQALLNVPPSLADALFHVFRGRAYLSLERSEKAELEFRAAVAAAPGDPAVWLARGWVFAELGHLDRSNADFAKAAALPSADPMPWIQHGRWLAQRGDHARAESAFARAATLTPDELNRFIEAGWWVVGPYPENLAAACPPEHDPDPSRPAAASSSGTLLPWQPVAANSYGLVDLRAVYSADHISAYAMTFVESPDERTATLLVGGDDRVRVWLNGQLVHETITIKNARWALEPVPVTLRAGRNTILVKVSQTSGSHFLIVRLADNPIDRGDRFARLGLWREAAAAWDQVFQGGLPDDPPLRQRYAALLWAAGEKEKCGQLGKTAFERFGMSDSDVWLASDMAMTCNFAPDGHTDFARLARLHEQCAVESQRVEGNGGRFLSAALTHLRAGRFEHALELVGKFPGGALWKSSLLALAYHGAGLSDQARQELADADRAWEGLVGSVSAGGELKAPTHGSWFSVVLINMLRREAKAKIEGTDPGDDPRVAVYQDRVRAWLKHVDKTTADYDLELLITPAKSRLWLARGRRLAELGRGKEAEADFDKAVQIGKAEPETWAARGRIFAELGRPDRAARDFAKALDLAATLPAPSGSDRWNAIAKDLASLDETYDRVPQNHPGDDRLRWLRIYSLARLGRWDKAVRVAEELSRPADARSLVDYRDLTRACLFLVAGDRDGYQRLCRETVDRYQSSDNAAMLMLADRPCILAPDGLADFNLSIQLAEQALKGELPDRTHFPGCSLYVLGAAYYRAGQFEQAVRCCRRSIEEYPGWMGTMLNWPVLALAYHRLGNGEEARKSLSKAWDRAGHSSRGRFNTDLLHTSVPAWLVNVLEMMVWLREAEAVILDDPAFPADPFAP